MEQGKIVKSRWSKKEKRKTYQLNTETQDITLRHVNKHKEDGHVPSHASYIKHGQTWQKANIDIFYLLSM